MERPQFNIPRIRSLATAVALFYLVSGSAQIDPDIVSIDASVHGDSLKISWVCNRASSGLASVLVSSDQGEDFVRVWKKQYTSVGALETQDMSIALADIFQSMKKHQEEVGSDQYLLKLGIKDENVYEKFSKIISVFIEAPASMKEMLTFIAPNPVHAGEQIHLVLKNALSPEDIESIALHTLDGQKIAQYKNTAEMTTAGLPSGTYFLILQTTKGPFVMRLIIEK